MSEFHSQTLPQQQKQGRERASQKSRESRGTGRGAEKRAKPEEGTENFVFLFSMSVTRVTPGLYINMAKKPPCLGRISFPAAARPLLPVTLTRGAGREGQALRPRTKTCQATPTTPRPPARCPCSAPYLSPCLLQNIPPQQPRTAAAQTRRRQARTHGQRLISRG